MRGILPDTTAPANPYLSAEDNPYVEFTYDLVGNKLTERDPNGSVTTFGYTPRYWLKSVQDAAGAETTFGYDNVGNQTSVTDANNQTTTNVYDDLNRLVKTVNPYNQETTYAYDRAGNRTKEVDTNKHATEWTYNPLKKLTQVKDARGGVTRYQYDPNGNLVAMTDANSNTTRYEYNELNWLTKETNSLGLATAYAYDLAGNRSGATSPRGVQTSYQYYPNNLLKDVTYSLGDQTERISYEYDQAGNRTRMTDPSGQAVYAYDPLNQVTGLGKSVLGRSYQTEYRYDKAGNVTGIKYPTASAWLEYQYNNVGRVYAIPGFADGTVSNPAFAYDGAGNIRSIRLNSGVTSAYTPDKLNRLQAISVTSAKQPTPVLSLAYTYDGEGNILTRNDNTYRYDELDRLVYSQVRGIFADDIPSRKGLITGDFTGQKPVNYGLDESTPVSFDYASSSVGLDFGGTAPVRRVYLAKDDPQADTSRVKPSTLDLYAATGNNTDGQTFEKLDPSSYLVQQTLDGYTFTFPNPVYASEFKVHSKFDERNEDNTFADNATFKSTLDAILRAEEEVSQATLEYGYDAVGNRTYERFTKATVHARTYTYYANSNRLLSDGKYAFVYDADGNLIRKGNKFTIQGEDVAFTTSGRGVEYWEYRYNLRNQLTQVHKNGQLVATYAYDGLGLRVTATSTISSQVTGESKTTTRDYVFDLMDRVIYDQVISTSGQLPANEDPETSATNSYIFANGTHFAKVEGAIGSGAEVYFYHNDHLGSPMAITDSQGNLAWSQDYLPYGEALNESATQTKTRFTFTGKELDPATGLYYYNARWYDADLGRFVTEDTYAGDPNDPSSLNRFIYTRGNPLKYIDPTGHDVGMATREWHETQGGYEPRDPKEPDEPDRPDSAPPKPPVPQFSGLLGSTPAVVPLGSPAANSLLIPEGWPLGPPKGWITFPGKNGQKVTFAVYDARTLPGSSMHIRTDITILDQTGHDIVFIPPGMENAYISDHFQIKEFQSNTPIMGPDGKFKTDSQGNPISAGKDPFIRLDPELVERLESLRDVFNEPITITSGYRSPGWNSAIKGAAGSQHVSGKAADFTIRGFDSYTVQDYLFQNRDEFNGGIGYGDSRFTHYDVGNKREWVY